MLIKQRQHGVIRLLVESSQSASFSDPPLHSEISSLDEVMHNMREYLLRRQLSPGSTPTATTSTPPPPPPPPSPPVIECLDKNTSCSAWAQNGECAKNPTYMNDECCISCHAAG